MSLSRTRTQLYTVEHKSRCTSRILPKHIFLLQGFSVYERSRESSRIEFHVNGGLAAIAFSFEQL